MWLSTRGRFQAERTTHFYKGEHRSDDAVSSAGVTRRSREFGVRPGLGLLNFPSIRTSRCRLFASCSTGTPACALTSYHHIHANQQPSDQAIRPRQAFPPLPHVAQALLPVLLRATARSMPTNNHRTEQSAPATPFRIILMNSQLAWPS
jgi:hypothetical protein